MKKPIPFGKYYLLERINTGGMAEVFRAKAYGVEGFERLVAVKRIRPRIAEDEEFTKMFVDEAKIAVQLNHANVAQIFDLGRVEGAYYIALEHVHGRDLRILFERCAERGARMPIAQALYITMKVCEGLDYAHNKRDRAGRPLHLVHRDVSPQNILVSFEGEVKLIDFGIAKAAGKGAETRTGILKGKLGYMSPEQVRGLDIDRRSDIFSCGIVLYELLTGKRLFLGASDFSTLEKVRNAEILPPSTYHREIPEELEDIVLKALAKDVDERYQNAIDLHDALQDFVYKAGAFGSRKDLAAWMKGMFAREIEEETAKLERYRQVHPPPPPPGARRSGSLDAALPPITAPGESRDAAEESAEESAGDPADGPAVEGDVVKTRLYGQETPANVAARAGSQSGMSGMPGAAPADAAASEAHDATLVAPAPPAQEAPRAASRSALPADPRAVISPGEPVMLRPGERPGVWSGVWSGKGRYIGIAAAAVLLLGGGLGGYALFYSHGAPGDGAAAASSGSAGSARGLSAEVLAATGIDLVVEPREATVTLDGKVLRMSSPMRIRHLEPGEHELIVDGAGGFYSKTERVTVTAGKAELIQVSLEPLNITGRFASEPPGASVSLVIGGDHERPIALGPSPAVHALDPRKRYQVIFEKDGYETARMPVRITGRLEEQVTAVLVPRSGDPVARAAGAGDARRVEARPADVSPRSSSLSSGGKPPAPAPRRSSAGRGAAPTEAHAPATGTLMLGAKPPCRILIDGKDTGKMTPQRDLALAAGKRRITLVNREHGIEESFVVRIEAGKTARVIKDMTKRLE